MKSGLKRIGILTSGGDCPGLNAAIRALTKKAIYDHDLVVIGLKDGFSGLVEGKSRELTANDVSGILVKGGTVLGSSNRADVFRYPVQKGKKTVFVDRSKDAVRHYRKLALDALFVIGGDGSLTITHNLLKKYPKLNIIGLPKTIDNDVQLTDVTFGFNSAVQRATEAIDDLHTTAMSHHRVMVVEVMGRDTGWLALESGVAGGGDVILLPEFPYDINKVCDEIKGRLKKGKLASIVVAAEGAKPRGGEVVVRKIVCDGVEPKRLGGIGQKVADDIEECTGLESRVTVLGHLLRSGVPTAYDRLLATRFGSKAIDLAVKGRFKRMVALKGADIVDVPINKVVPGQKLVAKNHPLVSIAKSLGTTFGV
ncbi:MAG: ATP-dependent 6-phosphofructokinase [Candidatus Altiarchaeota archaeon]